VAPWAKHRTAHLSPASRPTRSHRTTVPRTAHGGARRTVARVGHVVDESLGRPQLDAGGDQHPGAAAALGTEAGALGEPTRRPLDGGGEARQRQHLTVRSMAVPVLEAPVEIGVGSSAGDHAFRSTTSNRRMSLSTSSSWPPERHRTDGPGMPLLVARLALPAGDHRSAVAGACLGHHRVLPMDLPIDFEWQRPAGGVHVGAQRLICAAQRLRADFPSPVARQEHGTTLR
jgi:hypothetical protein